MYLCSTCRNTTDLRPNPPINGLKRELTAIFSELDFKPSSLQFINGRPYKANLVLLEGDVLFNIARKQWRQAEDAVLLETSARNVDVSDVRKQILQVLSLSRYSIRQCSRGPQRDLLQSKLLRYLKLLRASIQPWTDLDEASLIKLASTSIKDDQLPIHHYFHMYLDVHWLILSVSYLCEAPLDCFDDLLKDLVGFSLAAYKKRNQKDVTQESELFCVCFKRLWILLQLFSVKMCEIGVLSKSFWEMFNEALTDKEEVFSLWLLHHVAALQGYNVEGEFEGPTSVRVCENRALIDAKLKLLNSKTANVTSDNNLKLLNCCKLLDSLLNEWWVQGGKSEPYQVMWEVFNKHINLDFGTGKANSAVELVELVNRILTRSDTSNSYQYFLHMLNRHLTRFPEQWPRMRGRIYCKLPPHKINELSDVGLCNITLLFLSLATSVNLQEMKEKLASLLANLTRDRRNSPFVLNVYMSFVITYVHHGYSVREVCGPLVQLVQEASENREMFQLIRVYVDGFDGVLNVSQDFGLNQHVLIGRWILKYVTCCQYGDLCYFLNVLLCNVKRIRSGGAWTEWESVLKEHVLPALKAVAVSPTAPPQVGELAAIIKPNASSDWVLTFTSDVIAPKVTCQFISTLLEDVADDFTMPKNHETAVLHAWTRCCLLKVEDSATLSKNVSKIRALSSIFATKLDLAPDQPLISFVKLMNTKNSESKPPNLQELCEQCFGRVDAWVGPYLKAPTSEMQALHIYTCMSVLFLNCASLLYHKNRSSCLLNRLVSVFLLPTDILMGNSPHPFVLGAIQRTWHVFMQGIFTLDCSSDPYLERTLRDMVVRYVPLLSTSDSPILKCLRNEKLAALVLERIGVAFLARAARSSDSNTTKALMIVRLALESVSQMKIVLQSTLTPIMEVVMFNANKSGALEIVRLISSGDRQEVAKEYIRCSVITVTERHMAFNASQYFQFVNLLARIVPDDLRAVLHTIKKQVVEVERMRGVGYDNTLRQGFDRLEMLLTRDT